MLCLGSFSRQELRQDPVLHPQLRVHPPIHSIHSFSISSEPLCFLETTGVCDTAQTKSLLSD